MKRFLLLILLLSVNLIFAEPVITGFTSLTPDATADQEINSNEYLELISGTYDYNGNGQKSITIEGNGVLIVRAGVTLDVKDLIVKDQGILYVERGAIVIVERDFEITSTGDSEIHTLYYYANTKISIDNSAYKLDGNGRITFSGSSYDVQSGVSVCIGTQDPTFYDPDHSNFGTNGTEPCNRNGDSDRFTTDLPVEMISFESSIENHNVILNWATATEINASHFVVFRSTDKENWEEIGEVEAGGNTNYRQDYSFTDIPNASSNVVYYKLEQFDYNGKSETFGPLAVSFRSINLMSAQVYPNPVRDQLNLSITGLQLGNDMTISLMDKMGKVIHQEYKKLNGSSLIYNVDETVDLVPGNYLLIITSGSEKITKRFIKQ
ncbi:T9SS type A sorting domain-containing protein [Flammeovirga sp. MY04]|uniref:T9SS type A sorting domain-containing protein n=1 Tax=Flammeovirga sp. MY04 TaxID=1191459 RepID=UPI000806102B|nr:T9SS type A sorting domain-containing protein [Flammeovirga sp. MY04]ANQ52536.1 T9SS type A sorting domain-containing protein [Flammeovirga sp. MY04]